MQISIFYRDGLGVALYIHKSLFQMDPIYLIFCDVSTFLSFSTVLRMIHRKETW